MSNSAIRAFLSSEPRTLSALEAALGVSLGRDATGDEAWLVRRNGWLPGVSFLYVALVGPDLASSPDPMIDELRLFTDALDLRAEATAVLGPPEPRGGEVTTDVLRGTTSRAPVYSAWSRALGVLTIHGSPTQLFWTRHEGAYETTWPDGEAESVLASLRTLVSGPIDEALVQRAFGKLVMSGIWPQRFRRGPTWKLTVDPVSGAKLRRVTLLLRPSLPLESVLGACQLGPTLVATTGVHQQGAAVIDAATRSAPRVHGSRLDIDLESLTGATPSAERVPAQRAYETAGLRVRQITFALG